MRDNSPPARPIAFRATRPIDPDVETIIALSRAARGVKPTGVSPATFARWLQRGVLIHGTDERVRPGTIRIGGRRMTSVEAMREFFAAQNEDQTPAPGLTQSQRQRQSEAARRELEKLGI